jgi:hypothetical protein
MIRSLAATWRLVMDSNSNPLMRIPKMQRFQMMQVLAWMWSLVFAAWVGSAMIFGVGVVGHAILLIGIFFTAGVFRHARRNTSAAVGTG